MRVILKIVLLVLVVLTTSFDAQEKKVFKIIVRDFVNGDGIKKEEAAIISNFMRNELINSGRFKVVAREEFEQALKDEALKQKCGVEDCDVDVGAHLKADKLLKGTITKLDGELVLDIKVIEVKNGLTSFGEDVTVKSMKEFKTATRDMTNKMITKYYIIDDPTKGKEVKKPVKTVDVPTTKELPKTYTNSIGMEFVLIPAGEFMMGCSLEVGIIYDSYDSDCSDDEKPAHKVKITKPFYMGKYEVTQEEWRAVMGSDPKELYFKGCDKCPVERVSWEDVQEYIKKLNEKEEENRRRTSASSPSSFIKYRLPTEAEWEYAARGGTKTKYYWGNEMNGDYAWYSENSNSKTHPVGQKKPNAFGLYDMIGNVWEWCEDWYDRNYYERSVQNDPINLTSASYHVVRGGSWDFYTWVIRSSFRYGYFPSGRSTTMVFGWFSPPPISC